MKNEKIPPSVIAVKFSSIVTYVRKKQCRVSVKKKSVMLGNKTIQETSGLLHDRILFLKKAQYKIYSQAKLF